MVNVEKVPEKDTKLADMEVKDADLDLHSASFQAVSPVHAAAVSLLCAVTCCINLTF